MAATIMNGTGMQGHAGDMTQYALFMGGTNVVNEVLGCYDPLKTGYGRLFMVRKPTFLMKDADMAKKLNNFKHILEYGNTSVNGISDISVSFNQIQGGYVGKSFEIPAYASDDTNQISVTVYEFSGSPVREVLHSWINGATDLLTGLTHYNGIAGWDSEKGEVGAIQANQTAEFIWVNTDSTGKYVEYACLLANCFPKGIALDKFNYSSGSHELVEMTVDFTCTKYESIQINKVAQTLINKYRLLTNSLNFYSGIDPTDTNVIGQGRSYNVKTGKLEVGQNNADTASYVNPNL